MVNDNSSNLYIVGNQMTLNASASPVVYYSLINLSSSTNTITGCINSSGNTAINFDISKRVMNAYFNTSNNYLYLLFEYQDFIVYTRSSANNYTFTYKNIITTNLIQSTYVTLSAMYSLSNYAVTNDYFYYCLNGNIYTFNSDFSGTVIFNKPFINGLYGVIKNIYQNNNKLFFVTKNYKYQCHQVMSYDLSANKLDFGFNVMMLNTDVYNYTLNITNNKLCITSYDILSIQSVGPVAVAVLSTENIGKTFINNSDSSPLNLNNTITTFYYNNSKSKWEESQTQMI
jgi:hypothetical protein